MVFLITWLRDRAWERNSRLAFVLNDLRAWLLK